MDVIQQAVINNRLREKIAKQITGAINPGSQRVYEYKVKHLQDWCDNLNTNTWEANIRQVAEFLQYCFEYMKLCTFTIKYYRVSLARLLEFSCDIDLSK